MSRETWEIVQESGIKNVEIQLALQCAPLIAGLKISNLFQISIEDYIQVLKILKNSRIMIYPLGVKGNTIALLLYRKRSLEGYLDQEKVKELLKEFGYSCTSLKEILVTFRKHYQEYLQKKCPFPHEIGFLLGYPPEDVEGFIHHKEEGCKCIGCWRVYGDEKRARKVFRNYQNCTRAYLRSWECGRSLEELTVAGAEVLV